MRHDVVLTEAPEAHEDSHVNSSPLHGNGGGGVKAGRKDCNKVKKPPEHKKGMSYIFFRTTILKLSVHFKSH